MLFFGGCFRSELHQLLLSLWFLALWLCRTAPKGSTMEVHLGDFCVGNFFRCIREFPRFYGMPGGPIGAFEHDLNGGGEIPGIPLLCMSEVSAHRLLVSLWRGAQNPSLLQTPVYGAWKAGEGQLPTVRAFWVQRTCRRQWEAELGFQKSSSESLCYKNVNLYFFLHFVIMSGPGMPR